MHTFCRSDNALQVLQSVIMPQYSQIQVIYMTVTHLTPDAIV
jgi:hypothetical protein